MFSLENKTAIISGGSKGIGKAIAFKYAEAGANVIICSRKKENLDTARTYEDHNSKLLKKLFSDHMPS